MSFYDKLLKTSFEMPGPDIHFAANEFYDGALPKYLINIITKNYNIPVK